MRRAEGAKNKSLVARRGLVQKADMIRRAAALSFVFLAAACAAKTPVAPRAPTTAAIPSAPPRGEPSQYFNMPEAGLQAAFGRPAFVRKDGATEMWRYDGEACRAFFFLYGAPLAVRHVETLPRGVQSAADSACLTVLRVSPPKTSWNFSVVARPNASLRSAGPTLRRVSPAKTS
jgi:hypothetical protein